MLGRAIAVACSVGLAGGGAWAQDKISIGFVTTLSGPTAVDRQRHAELGRAGARSSRSQDGRQGRRDHLRGRPAEARRRQAEDRQARASRTRCRSSPATSGPTCCSPPTRTPPTPACSCSRPTPGARTDRRRGLPRELLQRVVDERSDPRWRWARRSTRTRRQARLSDGAELCGRPREPRGV